MLLLFEMKGVTRAWGPTQGRKGGEGAKLSVAKLLNANNGNDEANAPCDG